MRFLYAVMAATLLGACSSHDCGDIVRIGVDVDSVRVIDINPEKLVQLETSDSAMLYDINALVLTPDRFVVHSRSYLRAYDRTTGRFVCNVAYCGDGAEQFSHVGNLWLDGDTLVIFDSNTGALLKYGVDGSFFSRTMPLGTEYKKSEKPRQYFEVPGVGIFTTNFSTDHTTELNPRFSFYPDRTSRGRAVANRELNEPTFLTDGAVIDSANNRLLSWEPLRDTVYAVNAERVEPIYHIDFGSRALPAEVQSLPYTIDRAEAFNSRKDLPYISFVRYVQPHGDKLYFSFACADGTNYLACYHVVTGKTDIRHLKTADGAYSQTTFFKIDSDSAFVEMRDRKDLFANPLLYPISLDEI